MAANADNPWIPISVGVAGFMIGLGLAYVVTRPKSAEQIAHEMYRENAIRKHVRRQLRGR